MIRRPPRSTRTDTLFPYTTLFRSTHRDAIRDRGLHLAAARPTRLAQLPERSAPRRARPIVGIAICCQAVVARSEEHTSVLQSLMRISYAVFCLKKKKRKHTSSDYKNKYQSATQYKLRNHNKA